MLISIITLFPEVFEPILNSSILKRAQQKQKVSFKIINLRQYGEGSHKSVDDRPYGGGAGMVLRADVLAKAVLDTRRLDNSSNQSFSESNNRENQKTILMSASGTPFKQKEALKFSKLDHLIIVCGHYEGVDQRFIEKYIDQEVSIGDYVLTGGEIPAMVITDAITRLIPGVLDKPEAIENESFTIQNPTTSNQQLIEHPQYTRPETFEDKKVPAVLLSGNHQQIAKWRNEQALKKTKKIRPDLIKDLANK